jgi:hypothetical protein
MGLYPTHLEAYVTVYTHCVTGSDTHIYYLLTELLWEQYCRLFGQHPKVRKQIADTLL